MLDQDRRDAARYDAEEAAREAALEAREACDAELRPSFARDLPVGYVPPVYAWAPEIPELEKRALDGDR